MPEIQDTAPDPEMVRAHRERVAGAADLWSAIEVMRHASDELNAALTADDLAIVLAGLPEILRAGSHLPTGASMEIRCPATFAKAKLPRIPSLVMRQDVRDFVFRSYMRPSYLGWMTALPEEERLRMLEELADHEPVLAWDTWTHLRELPGLGRAGLRPLLASDDPNVRKFAMRAAADPMGELPNSRGRRRK